MKYFLMSLLALMFSLPVSARSFQWTEVERLSLEIKKIGPGKRDPYFDPDKEKWGYNLNLLWDVRVAEKFFMHSDTYFDTSNSKVAHIGWHFRSGINITDWLDVVHEHHSRHSADKETGRGRFPVEDNYGIRINFITE